MESEFSGVLDASYLRKIIGGNDPMIRTTHPQGVNTEKLIQPSSIDLTIGDHFYCMGKMSVPARGQPVSDMLTRAEDSFKVRNLEEGMLHSGYTYIVPLQQSVKLPKGFTAKFSPKSSIGRIDVFVHVLADGIPYYDQLPEGYEGRLYLEITPLSFRVRIGPNEALVQMRIKVGEPAVSAEELLIFQSKDAIFFRDGRPLLVHELDTSSRGVYMHIDLDREIVGFESRTSAPPISLKGIGAHDWRDYWEPIKRPRDGKLVMQPDKFYLPATKEGVRIPDFLCGDILPYDAAVGEIRTHYAGFFDPGFGAKDGGTIGVLEMRGREAPYELYDGKPICVMGFERLVPGASATYSGNYTDRRPSLSKFFTERYEAWEGE